MQDPAESGGTGEMDVNPGAPSSEGAPNPVGNVGNGDLGTGDGPAGMESDGNPADQGDPIDEEPPPVEVPAGFTTCPYEAPALPDTFPDNWTSDEVTVFNDNGAWTWYGDERAVVDAENGKIIVGSDANARGPGGDARNGTIEAVIYDVATRAMDRVQLGQLGPDDHNTPAFLVQPGGRYLAFYAGHNQDCNSYWRNYAGGNWGPQQTFNWTPLACPWGGRTVTYNNLFYMTAENRIYNFTRTVDTSPNLLISDDDGASWQYGGRLTSTPLVGYVAGYYKYWGNGRDRIDFLATEAHPRDNDNSLYHGYVTGGRTYDSAGVELDADISDGNSPQITAFTTVFGTRESVGGVALNHLWNMDFQRHEEDGIITVLWTGRADEDGNNPDHRLAYSRFDGTSWQATYLGRGGEKLYDSEQDYVGLGALHPNDPRVIYISTPIDPRDDSTDLGQHEIFKGTTCDGGQSFEWTPITMNSSVDDLRPIVPAWDESNMVLLWFRGTYDTAQIYQEEVVGIVSTAP